MADLNVMDFEVDPAQRTKILQQNNQVQSAAANNIAADAGNRLDLVDKLMRVQGDETLRKALHDKQTADQAAVISAEFDTIIGSYHSQFIETQTLEASMSQELWQLRKTAYDPNIPDRERRKAQKEFNELNTRLGAIDERGTLLGKDIMEVGLVQRAAVERLKVQRDTEFQTKTDVARIQETQELQRKLQVMNAKSDLAREHSQFVSRIQTLTPGELQKDEKLSGSFMQFLNKVQKQGQVAGGYDGKDDQQLGLWYETLQRQDPQAARELLELSFYDSRSREAGMEMSFGEIQSIGAATLSAGTLGVIASLSGDQGTQVVTSHGVEAIAEASLETMKQEYLEANGKAASGKDLHELRVQAYQQARATPANDAIQVAAQSYRTSINAAVQNAGSKILQMDYAQVLPAEVYGQDIFNLVTSDEYMKIADAPVNSLGNETLSVLHQQYMYLVNGLGGGEQAKGRAITAMTRQVEVGAGTLIRNSNLPHSALLDVTGRYGHGLNEVGVNLQIPRSMRRFSEAGGRDTIDVSKPIDLAYAMELIARFQDSQITQAQQQEEIRQTLPTRFMAR